MIALFLYFLSHMRLQRENFYICCVIAPIQDGVRILEFQEYHGFHTSLIQEFGFVFKLVTIHDLSYRYVLVFVEN